MREIVRDARRLAHIGAASESTRLRKAAGRQHIDRDAEQALQFDLNSGQIHERRFRGRVDEESLIESEIPCGTRMCRQNR